jgi:signal transduction histidine kinase
VATLWIAALAVAAQLAPPLVAALASLALISALLVARRHHAVPLGRVSTGVLLLLATLQAGWWWLERGSNDPQRVLQAVAKDYLGATVELSDLAEHLAATLGRPPSTREERLALFRTLTEHLDDAGDGRGVERRLTALLVDPDGAAVAWAGGGLRHSLPDVGLRRHGLDYVASFTAVTLYAIAPLDDARRPWRVVVGRSDSTGWLPFGPSWLARRPPRGVGVWTVSPRAVGGDERRWEVELAEAPVLRGEWELLRPRPIERGLRHELRWPDVRRGILVVTALWVLWLALSLPVTATPTFLAPLALAGTLFFRGVGVAWPTLLLTLLGASAWVWAGHWTKAKGAVPRRWQRFSSACAIAVVGAMLAALALFAWARVIAVLPDPRPFSPALDAWLARLALWSVVAAGLFVAAQARPSALSHRVLALSFFALVPTAILVVERPIAAVALVGSAALLCPWACGGRRAALQLGLVTVVAAWMVAALWLAVVGQEQRRRLFEEVETRASPEVESERLASITNALSGLEVEELALGTIPHGVGAQDLALAVWQASPLAHGDALSTVRVTPPEGAASRFSFGLAERARASMLPSRGALDRQAVAAASDDLVSVLSVDGEPWAEVAVEVLPLPIAGRGSRPGTAELTRELLGGAGDEREVARLPGGASLVVEAVALSPDKVTTDPSTSELWIGGPWPVGQAGALQVVVRMPRLRGVDALSALAVSTAALLLAIAAVLLLVLLTLLVRRDQRHRVVRWASSYPRRLMLTFALLLGVPLLLINVVIFRALEDRLQREQRANGEAALASVERIVAEYLPTLDPGFSIEATLDDELLEWLSRVSGHEVNLYWRGFVYASSRPELFAAGILPRRIPGDVLWRLTGGQDEVAARRHEVGTELSYLELYRRVTLPGEQPDTTGLYLSVPLLAQQEEALRELAGLYQQTLAATTLLFVALIAVGARLASNFTEPVMEIVAGTDRIARGERSLGLAPNEPELATLVAAIDAMAERVALAREGLLREKQVIEGVVANITSAVVSFGRDRRVQMRNRAAEVLLGVQPGETVEELARRSSPVLDELLRAWPLEVERRTSRLRSALGEDLEWTMVWVPVAGAGDPAALLVVEDVTEVLRGQRLEAWAEMARMIAHEVKNPLTPIRLSAEHLLRVRAEAPERLDEIFERCLRNILEQVDELRETASAFSTYSQIPEARLVTQDLVETVRQVVEGYDPNAERGPRIVLHAVASALPLLHDRRLIGRVVRNLIENALHAGQGSGAIDVTIDTIDASDDDVVVVVADRGPGVPDDLLHRIFDPRFSTTSGGTGLGLAISRRIVEEHGGKIEARGREGGGLEVRFTVPRGGRFQADADGAFARGRSGART